MKNLKYDPPNQFSPLYQMQLGQELWEFMKRPCNLYLMEYATFLERPAVEPLQCALLAEFDRQEVDQDLVKQMIGDMARQIMVAIGYDPDEDPGPQKVDTFDGSLFKKASRYRKP